MITTIRMHSENKKFILELMKPQESYEDCIVRIFKKVKGKENA